MATPSRLGAGGGVSPEELGPGRRRRGTPRPTPATAVLLCASVSRETGLLPHPGLRGGRSIRLAPGDITQIPGSRGFDVSFLWAEKLALFLRVHQEEREREGGWENFVVLGRSKSSWKTLFILFRNETVDVEDVETRLKRHCDVLAVPVTVTDRGVKCEIELRQGEGGIRHPQSVPIIPLN